MTPTNRAREAAGVTGEQTPGTDVALTPREARINLIDKHADTFAAAAPRGAEARLILRDAQNAIRQIPELAECTPASLLGALMTATQLGLRPNVGALGHGWILPFRNNQAGTVEAQWILGYRGMIELGTRSGKISSIVARTIYENERYLVRYGLDETLEHDPILNGDRGAPILHYAIARFTNGGAVWTVIDEPMVEEAKKRSKSARNVRSPWNTDRPAMARKTAIRQLARFIPTASELAFAIAADESVRTDLSTEALGYTGSDDGHDGGAVERQTVASGVVEGEVVPDRPADPEPAPEASQPEPAAKPRRYGPSALRKGLSDAVEQRGGIYLWDVLVETVGAEYANTVLGLVDGEIPRVLDYLSTEQLRTAHAIDVVALAERTGSKQPVDEPDSDDGTLPLDGEPDPESDEPDPNQ